MATVATMNHIALSIDNSSAYKDALSRSPGRRRGPRGPAHLEILGPDSPARAHAEAFIARVFERAYGAQVTHFLPRLMVLRDADQRVVSAVGLRAAADSGLFLESYLDESVERALARAVATPILRAGIIEVGNLASDHRGGLRFLIAALTAHLKGIGAQWVVFTGVPLVLNAFTQLGIELHVLGCADKHRLGAAQHEWGRYYDAGPLVVAGNVARGYAALARFVSNETAPDFQI